MEILKTNKNDSCFLIDGSIFKCDKKVSEGDAIKHYCHCDIRSDGCPARAIVVLYSDGEKVWKLTRNHNGHAASLKDTEAIRFRNELKAAARLAPEKSSKEVYDQVMNSKISETDANLVDELVSALPDYVCMKSSIQRVRMEGRPVIPGSLEELNIDGEWTKNSNGDQFLLFQTHGREKIVGFATQLMLERLCDSQLIIMDGTFRVSPLLFSQLYTLHGQYRGGIFCFMYLLLPNKRRETYEEVIRLIQDAAQRIGKVFSPVRFLLDFEEAMILALRSFFPSASVKGCYFHFTQAIWRNCQKIGLAPYYNESHCVRQFVKGLMALPFVPSDEMERALNFLRSDLPPLDSPCRPLIDRLEQYFYRTWIDSRFSPLVWNCYQNFDIRTTNHVEGWHRKINAKVKVAHPTIYKFIRHIQDEESSVRIGMIQLDNLHRIPPMRRKYRELNQRLALLTSELNTSRISLESFLRAISLQISDPRPIIRE